jgi:hypothetical protein
MDRAEAEAVYDAGRDVCVQFILDLAARVERHEERLRRLEELARQDSRTSSRPPSSDLKGSPVRVRASALRIAGILLVSGDWVTPRGHQTDTPWDMSCARETRISSSAEVRSPLG